MWLESKNKKVKQRRHMKKFEGLEECTFYPRLETEVRSRRGFNRPALHSVSTSHSVQKYLTRMHKVRESKEREQERNDRKPGSGKVWKN